MAWVLVHGSCDWTQDQIVQVLIPGNAAVDMRSTALQDGHYDALNFPPPWNLALVRAGESHSTRLSPEAESGIPGVSLPGGEPSPSRRTVTADQG